MTSQVEHNLKRSRKGLIKQCQKQRRAIPNMQHYVKTEIIPGARSPAQAVVSQGMMMIWARMETQHAQDSRLTVLSQVACDCAKTSLHQREQSPMLTRQSSNGYNSVEAEAFQHAQSREPSVQCPPMKSCAVSKRVLHARDRALTTQG